MGPVHRWHGCKGNQIEQSWVLFSLVWLSPCTYFLSLQCGPAGLFEWPKVLTGKDFPPKICCFSNTPPTPTHPFHRSCVYFLLLGWMDNRTTILCILIQFEQNVVIRICCFCSETELIVFKFAEQQSNSLDLFTMKTWLDSTVEENCSSKAVCQQIAIYTARLQTY